MSHKNYIHIILRHYIELIIAVEMAVLLEFKYIFSLLRERVS